MDRRPYYLQKAHETAALAARFDDLPRATLLHAAQSWMVLFEAEDERLKSPLAPGFHSLHEGPSARSRTIAGRGVGRDGGSEPDRGSRYSAAPGPG